MVWSPGSAVKWWLLRRGIRVQRATKFDYFFARLLARYPGRPFVQVGANDGVRFDDLYGAVLRHGLRGLAIEPLPDYFARLVQAYAHQPGVTPVQVAVHPTASSATIYRLDPAHAAAYPAWVEGCASFLRSHLLGLGVAEAHLLAETVPCQPLMTLLTAQGMLDATYLQVDTEGFDAEVLRMVDFTRFRPLLIKYEHAHLSAADQGATQALLRGQGYALVTEREDTIAWRPEIA